MNKTTKWTMAKNPEVLWFLAVDASLNHITNYLCESDAYHGEENEAAVGYIYFMKDLNDPFIKYVFENHTIDSIAKLNGEEKSFAIKLNEVIPEEHEFSKIKAWNIREMAAHSFINFLEQYDIKTWHAVHV